VNERNPVHAIAIRTLDLQRPLPNLADVFPYARTRLFLLWGDQLLDSVDIVNEYQPLTPDDLSRALWRWLNGRLPTNTSAPANNLCGRLADFIQATSENHADRPCLPVDVRVSVVVATYDRPADLRNCLTGLLAQQTARPLEIVVVDNHPASGLTPPVVAEFPGVVLVSEPRQGLAYARNAGFIACRGTIAATTDDDVTVPPDWLEKLVAPFADETVMVTTGNTLPIELETPAQCLFEAYGGLGRGFERQTIDHHWFRSFRLQGVPTWRLGATANAAFRATIFTHPEIGLMDESLGPGMPSGVGEDTYLFYKVLKAGYKLVYEPSAYVWHRHRREMAALRRQLYYYSKGHVAYHLTTWLRDHDWRAFVHVFVLMPPWRAVQVLRMIVGRLHSPTDYTIAMRLLEIAGNLGGPWALWRSRQRVRLEGRSGSYAPVTAENRLGTHL
jgi:O-antigen biosynthesis protein